MESTSFHTARSLSPSPNGSPSSMESAAPCSRCTADACFSRSVASRLHDAPDETRSRPKSRVGYGERSGTTQLYARPLPFPQHALTFLHSKLAFQPPRSRGTPWSLRYKSERSSFRLSHAASVSLMPRDAATRTDVVATEVTRVPCARASQPIWQPASQRVAVPCSSLTPDDIARTHTFATVSTRIDGLARAGTEAIFHTNQRRVLHTFALLPFYLRTHRSLRTSGKRAARTCALPVVSAPAAAAIATAAACRPLKRGCHAHRRPLPMRVHARYVAVQPQQPACMGT
eukprot:6180534-Pleurochrysis_carterae.AAC.4